MVHSNTRRALYVLLVASLAARLALYQPHLPLWDASAYILMGKFLASYGSAGLIEPFRPLGWPLVLSVFVSLGFDPLVWGTVVQMAMSLGCIGLIYGIGAAVYGPAVGLIAAILLSASPSFFFWGHQWYSEIPALFAGLGAVYFFVRQRYFLAGLLAALSFYMKFSQLIVIAVLVFGAIHEGARTRQWRPALNVIFGCVLATLPFVMLHLFLYGDLFYPFKESGAIYAQGIAAGWLAGLRRVTGAMISLDPSLLLAMVSLAGLRWTSGVARWMIGAIGVLSVIWIGKMPTSIIRYALLALPFLYLLSADGLVKIHAWCGRRRCGVAVGLILIGLVVLQVTKMDDIRFGPTRLDRFQEYVRRHQSELTGNIWISSPATLVLSGLRADELLYYPVFNAAKARHLQSRLNDVQIIFIDTRDIPCAPLNDAVCEAARRELLEGMREQLTAVDRVDFPDGQMRAIFRR